MFSRLGTIPACDRQTDGQPSFDSKYRASKCRAGKKELFYTAYSECLHIPFSAMTLLVTSYFRGGEVMCMNSNFYANL